MFHAEKIMKTKTDKKTTKSKRLSLDEVMQKLVETDNVTDILDVEDDLKYVILVTNKYDQGTESYIICSNTYDKFFDELDDINGTDHRNYHSCEINTTETSVSITIESSPPDDDRGDLECDASIFNISPAQKKKIKSKLLTIYSDVDDFDYSHSDDSGG